MKLDQILPFARNLLEKAISTGDVAVDCTMGNGHDTVFLAKLVGEFGKVHAFDIQEQALANTATKLKSESLSDRVILHQVCHSEVETRIPAHDHGKITGAVFNLGYLPGADKEITTTADSTIAAIVALLEVMASGGIIVVVIYHGHPAGQIERDAILSYVGSIPREIADVLEYKFLNYQNNPPFIVAIEKK